MTNQPQPAPTFSPVPAVPIVVLSSRFDPRVLACGGVFTGPTLCAVLDAVCKMDAGTLELSVCGPWQCGQVSSPNWPRLERIAHPPLPALP